MTSNFEYSTRWNNFRGYVRLIISMRTIKLILNYLLPAYEASLKKKKKNDTYRTKFVMKTVS